MLGAYGSTLADLYKYEESADSVTCSQHVSHPTLTATEHVQCFALASSLLEPGPRVLPRGFARSGCGVDGTSSPWRSISSGLRCQGRNRLLENSDIIRWTFFYRTVQA